jgi:hypothetical protein
MDEKLSRLALTLAVVHIGDGDILGEIATDLKRLILLYYPKMVPFEDQEARDEIAAL